MRYFTPEIWAGWQANGAAYDRAMNEWKRNRAQYNRSLRKIAARLGARHGKFFTEHSLHDGRLLEFVISDLPRSKQEGDDPPDPRAAGLPKVNFFAGAPPDGCFFCFFFAPLQPQKKTKEK